MSQSQPSDPGTCSQCGFRSPPDFAFCGGCGASIATETPNLTASRSAVAHAAAERRQLTVVFCDLVESTSLSNRLDPEDLRRVVRQYQREVQTIVERYAGSVAQYLGDGVLVYFGYPTAHEDDPVRAIRCSLEMVDAVHRIRFDHPLPEVRLQARIGVHTGEVVVGDIGAGEKVEQLAMGPTPNLAARMQAVAEPGTVAMSEATHRLVAGFIHCQDLGQKAVKGFEGPIHVYRALAPTGARSGFEIAEARGLTPFVGRQTELTALNDRFGKAIQGQGGSVLVLAGPGIGKSRLLQAFRSSADQSAATWLTARCSQHFRNSVLNPIVDLLRRTLGLHPRQEPEESFDRLVRNLTRLDLHPDRSVPLLAPLLSIPIAEPYQPRSSSAARMRAETLQLILDLVLEASNSRPIVLTVEDIHWADPTTLELLSELSARAPEASLLVLLTSRPSLDSWRPELTHTLELKRLATHETAELISRVHGGGALSSRALERLAERADGIPLFAEELTLHWIQSGDADSDQPSIPTTLRDSLTARIDSAGAAKSTAQLAAVLGRRFERQLLAAVAEQAEDELDQRLEELVQAGLLELDSDDSKRWQFRHALIQDCAYDSLLRTDRRRLHLKVADEIESHFREVADRAPELLALHLERGGAPRRAVGYLMAAGERDLASSAYIEAVHHLERAVALVGEHGESSPGQELGGRMLLGTALFSTQGYAADAVRLNFERAFELSREGDPPLPVLHGLFAFHLVGGNREATADLVERFESHLKRTDNEIERVLCHADRGTRALLCGEFRLAERELQAAVDGYRPSMHSEMALLYSHDVGLNSLLGQPDCAWHLGFPQQAIDRMDRALEASLATDDPLVSAMAYGYAMTLNRLLRDPEAVLDHATSCLAIASEEGFMLWAALAKCGSGWAMAQMAKTNEGDPEPGIALLREGLATWMATGARSPGDVFRSLLADSLLAHGRHQEALAEIDDTIAWTHRYLGGALDSELHRLRGECLLGLGQLEQADAAFERGLEISRTQGSKSLELRVATSLARSLRDRNKVKGHEILNPVLSSFSEGPKTPDLVEATRLARALAAA